VQLAQPKAQIVLPAMTWYALMAWFVPPAMIWKLRLATLEAGTAEWSDNFFFFLGWVACSGCGELCSS